MPKTTTHTKRTTLTVTINPDNDSTPDEDEALIADIVAAVGGDWFRPLVITTTIPRSEVEDITQEINDAADDAADGDYVASVEITTNP